MADTLKKTYLSKIQNILQAMFPGKPAKAIKKASDRLARSAKAIRWRKKWNESIKQPRRPLHKAFFEKSERFSRMAEETGALLKEFEDEANSYHFGYTAIQSEKSEACHLYKEYVLSSLEQIGKYLEAFSRKFAWLADEARLKPGAPPKPLERSLAREIAIIWMLLSQNVSVRRGYLNQGEIVVASEELRTTLRFPLPQRNPKDNPLPAMTSGQKAGALCQTVGKMAGLEPYTNSIAAWQKRFRYERSPSQ